VSKNQSQNPKVKAAKTKRAPAKKTNLTANSLVFSRTKDIVASSAAALVSERTYKGHHRNKSTPTSSEKSENTQGIDFVEIF
jgi:hypothetical protein